MPSVVALVLNWCAEDDTRRCVESLEAQAYAALHICILDNASPDGSGERLARALPAHEYIQTGANLGYAGGNAVGIRRALEQGAAYVLVINDDAELSPGCLPALVHAMEAHPDAAIAAPTIVHRDTPERIWWAGGTFVPWKVIGDHPGFGAPTPEPAGPPRDVEFVSGCIMLLRTDAIREAGAFDPAFVSYVEDLDLSLRYREHGWRLLHVPSAVGAHAVPWPPPRPSPFAIEYRDRNRRRVAARHLGALQRLAFAGWFYPSRVVLLAGALLRGDRATARALVRGALGRLDGTSST